MQDYFSLYKSALWRFDLRGVGATRKRAWEEEVGVNGREMSEPAEWQWSLSGHRGCVVNLHEHDWTSAKHLKNEPAMVKHQWSSRCRLDEGSRTSETHHDKHCARIQDGLSVYIWTWTCSCWSINQLQHLPFITIYFLLHYFESLNSNMISLVPTLTWVKNN